MAREPEGRGAADTPPWPNPRRTAVVFVHGQGEQTPMTDVIELAESVWRTDPRAAPNATSITELAEVYSTPVYDRDESDQRRIITRVVDGQQVDFYQFYWADLMVGNRFQHLWIWFSNLMTRRPDEVPDRIWPIRQAAMLLALLVGVWGSILALMAATALGAWAVWYAPLLAAVAAAQGITQGLTAHRPARTLPDKTDAQKAAGRKQLAFRAIGMALIVLVGWILWPAIGPISALCLAVALVAVLLARDKPPANWSEPKARWASNGKWFAILAVLVIAAGGLLLLSGQLFAHDHMDSARLMAVILLFGATSTLVQLAFPKRRARAFTFGLGLGLAVLAAGLFVPAPDRATIGKVLAGLLGGSMRQEAYDKVYDAAVLATLIGAAALFLVGRWLNDSFLTPVMTDSARMFSNSPVNVPNQNQVRARGMALLRDLHDPKRERAYDRIVVLAHSLGSVVAYQLLTHYWGSVFAGLGKGPRVAAATAAVEAAAKGLDDTDATLLAWRAAVRGYWDALNDATQAQRPWKISDFVTIGSPLTYASLLLEETDAAFNDSVRAYKRHPTSPPQVRADDQPWIFHSDGYPHHAALFGATCWTNLFFPTKGLADGDLIGGALRQGKARRDDLAIGLGLGILDVNLDHDTTVHGFTHSQYWRWPERALRELRPIDAASPERAPPHVAAMRDALRLFATPDEADNRLLKPVASYPTVKLKPAAS